MAKKLPKNPHLQRLLEEHKAPTHLQRSGVEDAVAAFLPVLEQAGNQANRIYSLLRQAETCGEDPALCGKLEAQFQAVGSLQLELREIERRTREMVRSFRALEAHAADLSVVAEGEGYAV